MAGKSAFWDAVRVWGTTVVLVAAGFYVAYQFVKPAPPDHVTIAAGSKGGSAHMYAKRYAEVLARDGVTLAVLTTNGSVENLELLASGKADLALVQAGAGSPESWPEFASLGCLFYEPLWVIMRHGLEAARLPDMAGWKIAVGPKRSGTRILAMEVLGDNGLTEDHATLVSLPQSKAAIALEAGEIDAMFWVTGIDAPLLNVFTKPPLPRLFSFERWPAYVMRHKHLTHLVLPEGVVDMAANLPLRDVDLLSTTAELVTGPDFHPALADLFLMAAETVHHKGGLLETTDEFPRSKGSVFPVTSQAKSFFKSGPPFLQRYLPFWVANFVNRMLIMLLPLVTLLYPLFKLAPPAYRWQVRRRVYRWYERLRKLENRLDEARTPRELHALALEAEELGEAVAHISVPASFAHDQYQLRGHVELIRKEIHKRLGETGGE